jgi:adenylate cyclase
MTEERAQRRLAAILAADVVGYSRLMEADEAGTLTALKVRRTGILLPLISTHHGRVVKVMGDGVLVEFASAVNAVECAVALQEAMEGANAGLPENRRIVLRIGINLGDVMVEGSDLYGDGVNIAARIEGLAEPGSVFISQTVFSHVKGKTKLDFEDLGERSLKNMAEPVRVYRLSGTPTLPTGSTTVTGDLPSKPSIAVLPFANLSGDKAQDYISDGITENVITDLARFRDLFVIASNSSFAYKGRAVKIQDVCRELGVLYILEGSAQKSEDRIRISAQLIEGATGRHLWAERYDRRMEDVFALQEDVAEKIVGALATAYGGRLGKAWQSRGAAASGRNLEALDYFQRGMEFLNRFTREDNKRAKDSFRKAFEIEPNYAKPIAKLAMALMIDVVFDWTENPTTAWEEAWKFVGLALQRDDDEPWGHWALSFYCMNKLGQLDRALSELQKALELNPNDADVMTDYAWTLNYSGRTEEAIEWAARAMRLNPHYPEWYVMQLGLIYYDARRYDDAIATIESLSNSETILTDLYLAASHAQLGHENKARQALLGALKFDPKATIRDWVTAEKIPYKNSSYHEHLREGLRRAGMPE